MKYLLATLLLLSSQAYAQDDMDDLDSKIDSMEYRLQNVEKDVRELKATPKTTVKVESHSGQTQQVSPSQPVNPNLPKIWKPGDPVPDGWTVTSTRDGGYLLVKDNEKHGSH